ncbi:MAG: hypothetical protein ABH875_07540 [Candidatus Omnitrophota bacterium]
MKRMRRLVFGLAAAFFLIAASATDAADKGGQRDLPIQVSALTDRPGVGIGDRIAYSITVSADKDIEAEFPLFKDKIGDLDIKAFDSHEEKNIFGKKTITHKYMLNSYKPGSYLIPEAVVKYRRMGEDEWREVKANGIAVAVKSALEGEKGILDVRDIKGPVEIKGVLYFLPIIGVILIILAAVAGAYLFARKKMRQLAAPPPRPAHIIAYESLDRLNARGLLKEGRIKEYYTELSDIVRRYLENRFNLRAPEMTTEEFLIKARDTQELSKDDKGLLKEFMFGCDLVKFAKYGPTDSEVSSSSQSAKRLIDQTRPKEADGVAR